VVSQQYDAIEGQGQILITQFQEDIALGQQDIQVLNDHVRMTKHFDNRILILFDCAELPKAPEPSIPLVPYLLETLREE
jgi:hypothetical protein